MIEITAMPSRLSLNGDCLEITSGDGCDGKIMERLPLDELDALILSHPAVALSGAVLAACGEHRVTVLCCNRTYLPVSMVMPIFAVESHLGLLRAQLEQTLPAQKRIWQEIVRCKIAGQAAILQRWRASESLMALPARVRSGDVGNLESRAAVIYWKKLALFPARRREAEDANWLFNYVYAILYAATARAICAAGLEPHCGIMHSNPGNHFCLASDLMEPFRPIADECVLELLEENGGDEAIHAENRHGLCQRLYQARVTIEEKQHDFFDAVRLCVASYRHIILKGNGQLALPLWEKSKAEARGRACRKKQEEKQDVADCGL